MLKRELQVTIYELKFKNASSSPRVTSSNSRIIKSVKTQTNSFKSSSFPKILSEVTHKFGFWLQPMASAGS